MLQWLFSKEDRLSRNFEQRPTGMRRRIGALHWGLLVR
jgi:hypothetical protein